MRHWHAHELLVELNPGRELAAVEPWRQTRRKALSVRVCVGCRSADQDGADLILRTHNGRDASAYDRLARRIRGVPRTIRQLSQKPSVAIVEKRISQLNWQHRRVEPRQCVRNELVRLGAGHDRVLCLNEVCQAKAKPRECTNRIDPRRVARSFTRQ